MGLNLDTIATCTKVCGSNILKTVERSNPNLNGLNVLEKDVVSLRKIQNFTGEELTKSIKEAINVDSKMHGKEATCFNIPQDPNVILRVKTDALPDIKASKSEYRLIPIKYPNESFAENKRLGLPLYATVEKNSKFAKMKTISPSKAFSDDIKMWVMRKVKGVSPAQSYSDDLLRLTGIKPEDTVRRENFEELKLYLFGLDEEESGVAKKFLESCKEGNYSVKKGQYGSLWDVTFKNTRDFYDSYKKFSSDYLNRVDEIAKLPQKTFDEAISNIKNYGKALRFDFEHVNNTLIDTENKSINFIDFQLNPKQEPFSLDYEDPVVEFGQVLMGKRCIPKIAIPHKYLVYEEEQNLFREKANILAEKLNIACKNNNIKWDPNKFLNYN